ncbi:hypothetical protein I4U23_022439 [Adineta vaga]|nr:hypothetical protein I4U23_022439 [Adineta vaga]
MTTKEENSSRMWFELLIEILLRMLQTANERNKMIEECKLFYVDNSFRLKNKIDHFQANYPSTDAIKWYTHDYFLCAIGSIFKIEFIEEVLENVWSVKLTLSNNDNEKLKHFDKYFLNQIGTLVDGITLEFHNGLPHSIELVATQNDRPMQHVATVPTGKFFTYDCPQGFAGNFRHTMIGKDVTLFEISVRIYDANTYYDLSVIDGFNVPMKVYTPDGKKFEALHAKASDAYLFPKDDTKTHGLQGDGKFVIVFEY